MPEYTLEHLKGWLTTPYLLDTTENTDRWLQALVEELWSEWESERNIVIRDMIPSTSIGPALDRHARVMGLDRISGESDTSLRIRYYDAVRNRFGRTTGDDLLKFMASAIGLTPDRFTLLENLDPDTKEYRPAHYYVEFNIQALASAGFKPGQFGAAIALLNNILDAASAAGVRGQVFVAAGAKWDDADAKWDDVDTRWSSRSGAAALS